MARSTPEHTQTRLPLVEDLLHLGWQKEQIRFKPEWRVPATPSEASKREKGESYASFPTDVVIFDRSEFADDPDHVLIIFETKKPDEVSGRKQLEIYMTMEPSAKLGIWTNGSSVLRVYRDSTGKLVVVPGMGLPKPKESFLFTAKKRLKWIDLTSPTTRQLSDRFRRILDLVVARDSKSTRRDDQLNQICNLLLVKLESDKASKADPGTAADFQMWTTEAETAKRIKDFFKTLRSSHSDLFDEHGTPTIDLNDHTISLVAYELGNLKLFDTPLEVMSQAFQVFRTEVLKSEEGQYYTPYPIIESAVRMMDIHPKDLIIDPACGTGGFLLESFKALRDCYRSADAKDWAQRRLFGIDKDRINIKLTKAMMLIVGDGSTHVFRADSLDTFNWLSEYSHANMSVKDGTFTCVITNPPFGKNLTFSPGDGRRSQYTVCQKPKKASDPETDFLQTEYEQRELGIVFVERCYRLLVPGGRLGIILPETYFFSSSYMWFQGWLNDHFILRGVLNIPMEAFQGFCRAKTNFYVLEKRENVNA